MTVDMKKITGFCCLCWIALAPLSAQVNFTSSNLPIVVINTNGQFIPDEPKITATMGVIDNGPGQRNYMTDPFNNYNGLIGIELRGSSSQSYPKKAYGIETRDAAGEDLPVSLLGMPEESDWALIAPLNDKTLMRDVITHLYASRALPWSPRSRYCEVVLNGDYIGVYALIETIKRDADRVDIAKLEEDEVSGDDVTGGYILRMDKYGTSGGIGGNWLSDYPPIAGSWQQTWFQYDTPKEVDIQPQQAAYIQNHIDAFEDMLAAPNFKAHYEDWIDLDTWVNYLLVQEITRNVDGYRLSAYFYKDKDSNGGKIAMGPIWDHNISLGIGDYCEGANPAGWAKDFNIFCSGDGWVIHFWWSRLWSDPAFRQRVGANWQALRQDEWSNARLFGAIDSISNLLAESQVRNFQRWPVLGSYVWPNSFIGNSYAQEVNYLRSWLTQRLGWLDASIAAVSDTTTPPGPGEEIFKLYPNPADDFVYLSAQDGTTVMQSYDVEFWNTSGQLIQSSKGHPEGQPIRFDLPDTRFPPGVYICRVRDRFDRVRYARLVVK
jgi:hypothetical protein